MLQALRLLLVVALVLRGLVPVGFMPGTNPDGRGLSIVVCTPDSSRTFVLDANGEHRPSDGSHTDCLYGVVHAGAQNIAPVVDGAAFIRQCASVSAALFASQVDGWPKSMRQAPFAQPRAPPSAVAALV